MIRISGYSDDLVEISGDVEDEIGAYDQDVRIWLDDGTVIRMTYNDNGTWVGVIEQVGIKTVKMKRLIDGDDFYSEELTTDAGFVRWETVPIGG